MGSNGKITLTNIASASFCLSPWPTCYVMLKKLYRSCWFVVRKALYFIEIFYYTV